MLEVVLSNQFKRDLKLISKRGYNLEMMNDIVEKIARGEKLPVKNHDHELSGEYAGFRECHIQSDWLMVYRVEKNELILFLSRTGTHSDLF